MRISAGARVWLRRILWAMALLAAAGVVVSSFLTSPGDRLRVGGQPYFLAGVNYPWRTYQDFGDGAWGYSGVASSTTYAEVDTDFANMAARGVRVVKWRIFNDGRYSPEFDGRGYVTGLDDRFFADVDAALEIAERHDMYVVFTLFASGFWTTSCKRDGVQMGGHADVLTDSRKRRSLVEKAVIPLLRHVGHNPRVLAYEIVAEPEWGVAELNRDQDGRIKVPERAVRALVGDVARAIHTHTRAQATVESNRSRYMRQWRGLGLDFYTFSWYDWLEPYDPLDQPAKSLGVDRPVVLGEFPMAESKYYSLEQMLDIVYRQGYAGAFGWSYWGGDKYGQFDRVSDQYVSWERAHWPEVSLGHGEGAMPVLGAPQLSQPYAASVRQLMGSGEGVSLEVEVKVREQGAYQLQFFLQEVGNHTGQVVEDRKVVFNQNGDRIFRIALSGLAETRPYKVNLGLFDASGSLRKWFDGLTVIYLKDGALAPADLSVQAVEDPCY